MTSILHASAPARELPGRDRDPGPERSTRSLVRRQVRSWRATRWAARMIAAGAVVLDTETTDFDGAVCEIAVVDLDGIVLFETLLDPGVPISAGARRVHGLADVDLEGQPRFAEVLDELVACTAGRPVLAYNAPFDHAALCGEAERAGLDLRGLGDARRWGCVMRARAASEQTGWRALHGGHRARSDAAAAARIVRQIAGGQSSAGS